MEPRIQYAKTSDGVSIAFWTLGVGPALVLMPYVMPFCRIDTEWALPEARLWFERLAEHLTVVRYHNRGSGLSDREVPDFSTDAMIRDLEAVVNRLGLSRFALYAHDLAGPSAITFGVRQPQRVSRLVLWEAAASTGRWGSIPALEAVLQLADSDWETFTETIAHVALGWEGQTAHRWAAHMRGATTPEVFKAFRATAHDASHLPSRVGVPTLVAHERGSHHHMVQFAQELAAGIPDSRLLVTDVGEGGMPSEESFEGLLDFLGEGDEAVPQAEAVPQGTAIIFFADIVDSTALTERLGDTAFREKARYLAAALRSVIAENGGRPIEGPTLGDGVLATFTSARQAIEAALACGRAGDDAGLPLHLGLHAGDVTREKDPDGRSNVYGGAVNIASRISGLSAPGEVLVSDVVRSLARTSAGVGFEDRGEQALKGVGEPVRVWAVREGEA